MASTVLTLFAVPLLYFEVALLQAHGGEPGEGNDGEGRVTAVPDEGPPA